MALKRIIQNVGYGFSEPLTQLAQRPVIAKRAPTTADRTEIGTSWIDQPNNDVYILTKVAANISTWINVGGGTGTFNALTVTTTAVIGTTLTVSGLSLGLVRSSATGLLSTATLINGQLLVGSTGLAPVAATLTAGAGIGIVNGAGTITISAPGATAVQYTEDDTNFIVPDGIGNVFVKGVVGGNIVTNGATANTISINTIANPTFSGLVTAQAGFTQSAGTTTITSNTNAAKAIYLHTNGGVNETAEIYVDQSTQNQSLYLHSDVGGIDLASGLASALALSFNASNAAGGITFTAGTNGIALGATNGAVSITSGTGAVNLGADAAVHTVTLGSTVGASATVIQSGSGNLIQTSTGTLTLDSVGVLELNSSAAAISIGNDAVAQNINLGTGAAQRTITIGNATVATSVVVNGGTGAMSFGANATDHTTTLGSTNGVSATVVQSGTGAMTLTAGGALNAAVTGAADIQAAGAITIDSSGSTIGIGTDANAFGINIGTGGAARTITVGNAIGATSVVVNSGSGNVDIGVNATDHTTRLGSVTGVSATTVQAGTGAMTFTAGGAYDVNAAGAITIDSSASTIGIGTDAVAQNINIGTGAAVRIVTVGNNSGASAVHLTTGSGGLVIASTGLITTNPATDSQASPSATSVLNKNIGVATFTGFTTAAAAAQSFTITNALVSATSGILVSISNLGANDAKMIVQRVTPGAGSFVIETLNDGTQALNGNCLISFWVLN